ncbi:hypothetical protein KI387_014013, partial [Taxus chinensis]
MAKTTVLWLIAAAMAAIAGSMAAEINMKMYMHDVLVGRNRTAVAVSIGSITRPGFGATVMIDDILTLHPSPNSTLLGKAKGFYVADSLDYTQPDLLLLFTAVFEDPPEYRGSTLSVHGADRILLERREVAIVGGTGKFRFVNTVNIRLTM